MSVPTHIAIIMDGNGRWAQAKGLPRSEGHRAGAEAVRRTLHAAGALGVKVITLYSFSTENWQRPRTEIDALMALCVEYLGKEVAGLVEQNIRLRVIGRRHELPSDVRRAINAVERATADCTKATLVLALNYGSRAEITDAIRSIADKAAAGTLSPSDISPSTIDQHLDTAGLPDPDLLIRTAGEQRLSNYLLWQLSYAELHFTTTLWPDFSELDLRKAIDDYNERTRRFGAVVDGQAARSPPTTTQ